MLPTSVGKHVLRRTPLQPAIAAIVGSHLVTSLFINDEVTLFLDVLVAHCLGVVSPTSNASSSCAPLSPAVQSEREEDNGLSSRIDLMGNALKSRCRTFCEVLSSIASEDAEGFREQVNTLVRITRNSETAAKILTIDEILALTERVAQAENYVLPRKLFEYVHVAATVAFGSALVSASQSQEAGGVSLQALSVVICEAAESALSIVVPHTRLSQRPLGGSSSVAAGSAVRTALASRAAAAQSPSSDEKIAVPPFFSVGPLLSSKQCASKFRVPKPNFAEHDAFYSAIGFVIAVWLWDFRHWPLIIDPHGILEAFWIRTLPDCVTITFAEVEAAAAAMPTNSNSNQTTSERYFSMFMSRPMTVVVTDVPDELPHDSWRDLFGGRHRSAARHPDFRLLLIGRHATPRWAHASALTSWDLSSFALPPAVVASMITDSTYRVVWPAEATQLDEVGGELLTALHDVEVAETRLWETILLADAESQGVDGSAADSQRHVKAVGNAAQQHHLWVRAMKIAAAVQRDFDGRRRRKAEYRIVGELASMLFFIARRSEILHGRNQYPWARTFVASFIVPAVAQHVSDGLRWVTRLNKSRTVQEMVDWGDLLRERQLVESQLSASSFSKKDPRHVPESHQSVSIALHVLQKFTHLVTESHARHGHGGHEKHVERDRWIVALWDASLLETELKAQNTTGALPRPVIAFIMGALGEKATAAGPAHQRSAATQQAASSSSEADVFARVQRLLLTLGSVRSLLLMDRFDADLATFHEWCEHVHMTQCRIPSVEEDVLDTLIKGLALIFASEGAATHAKQGTKVLNQDEDPAPVPNNTTLVDAPSLWMALKEVVSLWKQLTGTLRSVVESRKAAGMAKLLSVFSDACRAVDTEAEQLLQAVLTSNPWDEVEPSSEGTGHKTEYDEPLVWSRYVNPNRALELRVEVQRLKEAKEHLRRVDPARRCGAGIPLMRHVDRLAALVLPESEATPR